MARRGRKRQLDTETVYWQLIQSGTGTVEACKIVGIGRKTGYRWRAVAAKSPLCNAMAWVCARSRTAWGRPRPQ